jgi:Fe-S cluster assembly protein SufD
MDTLSTWQHGHPSTGAASSEPAWLASLRARGASELARVGMPTPRTEAWHYTSVKRLLQTPFVTAPAVDEAGVAELVEALRVPGAFEVVLVNGVERPELGRRPAGVVARVAPLASAGEVAAGRVGAIAPVDDGFAAMSLALAQDGVAVSVDRGAQGGVVHLLHVAVGGASPAVSHPRHLVSVGAHAAITLVETSVALGAGKTLVNATVELEIDAGAQVEHVVADVGGGAEAATLRRTAARVGRDARYRRHVATLSGRWVRDELRVALTAPGAETELDGLFLVGGDDHVDHRTVVVHEAPRCTTREAYRGAVGERGTGVFDGTVVVQPDAQQTDASQSSHNLLLSADATVDAKPRLEIYADDVKCSHGTTIGQLDRVQLAYLRSRGIPAAAARQMLTQAFVASAVDRVADAGLRDRLRERVEARLAALLGDAS